MKLRVGILGEGFGWDSLLGQEGVPHSRLENLDAITECSAVVLAGHPDQRQIDAARTYLRTGGALLCSGNVYAQLTGIPSHRTFVKYLLPEQHAGAVTCGLLDLSAECDIPASAQHAKTPDGKPALFVGEYGGGAVAALPFDAGTLTQDHRTMTKSFYAHRRRLPHEQVSMVSKGTLRKLVSSVLQSLHHQRGLPYLHAWYYPRDARSLFALRIDTDYGSETSVDRLRQLSDEMSVPFSWFVHVRHQQKFLERFNEMSSHEIGVHCYDHIRYRDANIAVNDLQQAVRALGDAGIHAKSFCAPYGIWSEPVARAVEQFGFEYSSEFSYDYDNLPSFPVAGNRLKTLQVPVHPISIGSLRRQGCTEVEMLAYYMDVIHRTLDAHDPVIFYHHPNNQHEAVLKAVMHHLRQLGVPAVRMIDYARWWKGRDGLSFDAEIQGNTLNIRTGTVSDDVWLHMTKDDGTEFYSPFHPSIDLQHAGWKPSPRAQQLPGDYARARQRNPWMYLNRLEDALHNVLFPKP